MVLKCVKQIVNHAQIQQLWALNFNLSRKSRGKNGLGHCIHDLNPIINQEKCGNVGKTMPCLPSPSHHHFSRRYVYHSQSWVVSYCFNHMIFPLIFTIRQPPPRVAVRNATGRSARSKRWQLHRSPRPWDIGIPSGEHTKSYGKSPFLMGKSTISMAIFHGKMLVHHTLW